MLHTSLENINNDLSTVLYHAIKSNEEVSISTPKGAVILMPQDEYESMQETLRLLNDKKSLKALLDSHQQRDNHEPLKSYTLEEVFSDI